jgi:arsenate reductase
LQHLKLKTSDFLIKDYIKSGLTIEELEQLFSRLNKKPSEMIRKQESIYKTEFKGKQFTEDEWIRLIVKHPNLLQRPIILKDFKAIWADPASLMDDIF